MKMRKQTVGTGSAGWRAVGRDRAALGLVLGVIAAVAVVWTGKAQATPLLMEDFESFSPASHSGIEQLGVSAIGEGACARFSAGGSRAGGKALCGSGTRSVGGTPDPQDALVFNDPGGFAGALRIDLSLAAFEFGLLDGPADPPDLFDFVDILLGGERVVHFHGVNTRTTDEDGLRLAYLAGRGSGPDLVPADEADALAGRFFDFSFFIGPQPDGLSRDLTIAIGLTGTTEYAAIDSLSVTAIPAPQALGLFGLGLLGLSLAARRRRLLPA